MKRFVLLTLAAVGVIAAIAGTAFARGGGWEPLPAPAYDAACGATVVHVTAPVNKEYFRTTTLPDGTVRTDVTGSLKLLFSTDAGASVSANASGPGSDFFYPNGDIEFVTTGLTSFPLTASQAATLGVPQLQVSAGPTDVILHPDGSVSGHMGNIIRDICAELGS